jgi:hypothetical protein
MGSSGAAYEIRVRSIIGPEWAEWFDNMEIRSEGTGETVITGYLRDQAALHGLLNRIADLNLSIISVNRIGNNEYPETYLHDSKE